jgi:hypothetical protein
MKKKLYYSRLGEGSSFSTTSPETVSYYGLRLWVMQMLGILSRVIGWVKCRKPISDCQTVWWLIHGISTRQKNAISQS